MLWKLGARAWQAVRSLVTRGPRLTADLTCARLALALERRLLTPTPGAAEPASLVGRTLRGILRRATAAPDPVTAALTNRVAELEARLAASDAARQRLQGHIHQLGDAVALVAELHAHARVASPPAGRPLVSVLLPTRDRAGYLATAIDSVCHQLYPNWELLVIDDGSQDDTPQVVARYADDGRIRYLRQDHAGASVARNRGLVASRGEIITYLDSDNVWYPTYLRDVVAAFEQAPHRQSVYLAQVVGAEDDRPALVRGGRHSLEQLKRENGIDLNVLAHRREAGLRCGGFDPQMRRLIDWDFVLRLTQEAAPEPVPALGGSYRTDAPRRITHCESLYRAVYQVRLKQEVPIARPLRVLYLLHSFPQLSETYVRAEMDYMIRRGVHVEAWSAYDPGSPYPSDVPTHRGPFAEALQRCRPDVVHVHWLCFGLEHLGLAHQAGIPVTYRGHSFEHTPERARGLLEHPAVRRLYVFPHHARGLGPSEKVRALPVAFNPGLYYPEGNKDRRLVARAGLAKPTKSPETFLRAACQCPEFRFVLAVVTPTTVPDAAEQVRRLRAELASPAEVHSDLAHEDAARLVRTAGIFLHTYSFEEPFGMPISIAEAMATGAYVLAPRGPGVAEYLGHAGAMYGSAEEAAGLIRETQSWSAERWDAVGLAAVERAFGCFADGVVLGSLLDDWQAMASQRSEARRAG